MNKKVKVKIEKTHILQARKMLILVCQTKILKINFEFVTFFDDLHAINATIYSLMFHHIYFRFTNVLV